LSVSNVAKNLSGCWHGLCMAFRYCCSVSLKPHPPRISAAETAAIRATSILSMSITLHNLRSLW
jgi:hypothetical protein